MTKCEELVALADRIAPLQYATGISFTYTEFQMVLSSLRAQASAAPPEREAFGWWHAHLSHAGMFSRTRLTQVDIDCGWTETPLYALSSRDDGEVKSSDGPTYYDEGRDAEWFEKLSDSDFAERAIRAAQDLADSDITSVEQWIPIVAIVDDAARRIKRLISSGPSEAPSNIPADVLAMKGACKRAALKAASEVKLGEPDTTLHSMTLMPLKVYSYDQIIEFANRRVAAAISRIDVPGKTAGELKPWRAELDEVIGHLGAAVIQSTAFDDQIIMDHVKAAHEIAKIVRRKA